MSISGGSKRILLDLNVHKVLATAATTTAAAAAATVSQELWTSGGALFQRAQEPNIPFGESLTSTFHAAQLFACKLTIVQQPDWPLHSYWLSLIHI